MDVRINLNDLEAKLLLGVVEGDTARTPKDNAGHAVGMKLAEKIKEALKGGKQDGMSKPKCPECGSEIVAVMYDGWITIVLDGLAENKDGTRWNFGKVHSWDMKECDFECVKDSKHDISTLFDDEAEEPAPVKALETDEERPSLTDEKLKAIDKQSLVSDLDVAYSRFVRNKTGSHDFICEIETLLEYYGIDGKGGWWDDNGDAMAEYPLRAGVKEEDVDEM